MMPTFVPPVAGKAASAGEVPALGRVDQVERVLIGEQRIVRDRGRCEDLVDLRVLDGRQALEPRCHVLGIARHAHDVRSDPAEAAQRVHGAARASTAACSRLDVPSLNLTMTCPGTYSADAGAAATRTANSAADGRDATPA